MSRASLLHAGAATFLLLGLTHDVAEAQMEHDSGLWILANLQGEVAPQWSLNLEVDVRSFR